jgi:hypothetical protein
MGIKTSCNHKRQLYLLCKDSNDINLIKCYKQYFKILSRVINEPKWAKYNNQIINSTNKMKTTWNIIKSETNRLKRSHINYENSPDSFNDHFLSIAERIMQSTTESTNANNNPMYYMSKMSHNPFPNITFNSTSTGEIERSINSIKVKNSHGYDGITTKMRKASAPYICSFLGYIFNKSIRPGTFPSHLKYSIVKPLFKKGYRDNMANYQPISLLTSFPKIFEKIIYERLLQHIKVNNILLEEQFGFRPATSTDKASYRYLP